MTFQTKIIEYFKDKKNLSDSSIKNYIRNLQLLNDNEEIQNLNFLKNKEDIMKKLDLKKPNTRRSYLIAIVSALTSEPTNKLYEYYYDAMMNMNRTLKEEESKNIKTDKQAENWMEYEEIGEILNNLYEAVKAMPKKINKKEYEEVLKMVVLSLYYDQPPRRNADYQYMVVVATDKYINDDKINYLVLDPLSFWFRKYKTSKTELKDKNELVIELSDNLKEKINLYFKYHPLLKNKKSFKTVGKGEIIPFLVNYEGEPLLTVNDITLILKKIFNKNIGSSMMRHFYTSHKYADVLEDMKEDSAKMSHSLEQQKDYIKKN